MNDKRNEAEIKIHELVLNVLYILEGKKVSQSIYRDMVGNLRDIKVLLENKQFGCPTGRHAQACKCV